MATRSAAVSRIHSDFPFISIGWFSLNGKCFIHAPTATSVTSGVSSFAVANTSYVFQSLLNVSQLVPLSFRLLLPCHRIPVDPFPLALHPSHTSFLRYSKIETNSSSHRLDLATKRTSGPWRNCIVRFSALFRPCLGLYPFVTTSLSSGFLTTLLLLFLCLILPLISAFLFPCARYSVWDIHLVHGIPVPYCPCWMVPCSLVILNDFLLTNDCFSPLYNNNNNTNNNNSKYYIC